MNEQIAWLNGEYLPFSEAALPLSDSGIVHGDAVTEMLRTFRQQPFRVAEHQDRFRHSLAASLLECPYADEELSEVIEQVVRRATEDLPGETDLGVILFGTGGPNVTYVGKSAASAPTICVHTFPLHFELWKEALLQGQHLVVSEHPAISVDSLDPTIKSRSRMHWRIADRKVRRQVPGASALFATREKQITETSSGNLFAVLNREIVTPPAEFVLNGISRQMVIELSRQLDWPVTERPLLVEEALEAEELWTSSTPYCLLPVTRLNDRVIGSGEPGERYQQILSAWSELVGVDLRAQLLNG
ncbi:MAG: aminotransferase class IV [Planctomycetaceae bacterium]|nr:aminotransferase class IV [Planctomycetaceae bacterium]